LSLYKSLSITSDLDSIVFFRLSQGAGTYYFQVFGPSNVSFQTTAPIYNNPTGTCGAVGCNLIPNGSFENFNFTIAPPPNTFMAWGAFHNQANCWGNPNSTGAETPDLARADANFCPGTPLNPLPNGNRCFNQGYTTWAHGGTGLNAGGWNSAHIVIQRQPNDNRREYIQVPAVLANPNGVYYVRFGTRYDPDGEFYNDAMGLYFSHTNGVGEVQAVQGQFTQTANGLLLDLTPAAAPVATSNWEVRTRIFQNDGTTKDNMMVGNFLSTAATNARNVVQNQQSTSPFAWMYLDGFEMYELPNGGNDLTVCAGTPFNLGQLPQCAPPGTVSTTWLGPSGVVGTTPVVSQTLNTPGTYQYTLMITYGGEFFQDVVNVTVTPAVTGVAPVIVSDPCGTSNIEISGLNANYTYTVTSADITFNPMVGVSAPGGVLVITNPQMNYTGAGTLQIEAVVPGSACPTVTYSIGVAPCCQANPGGFTLVNEVTSNYFAGAVSGQVINVFGTVTIDQSLVFDNCTFFMGTDAQLVLGPGVVGEFQSCQFQVCGDFMWDRLFVPKTGVLVMVGCNISYAVRGVYLEDAVCQLESNTFEGNLTSNQFRDYQVHGQSVIFESNAHVLTGNTFNGIGIHPQSTLTWGGSLWNYNAYVIGTNIEQSVDLTLGSSGQSNNSYTGLPVQYNELIGVVNYQSVSDFNGGVFTGALLGYAGEDATCNIGTGGANVFDEAAIAVSTVGCNGTILGNQFIASNQLFGNRSYVRLTNPSQIGETYVVGNTFSIGAYLKGEALGGVPYNSTQPVRFRVNDNSFSIDNQFYPGTTALTLSNLKAQKSTTRKVMAHGNVISFDYPGAWETGIYAENCPEVLIAANDVVGPQTSVRLIGIHVNNSSDGDVKNNYLSMLHDGIRISGVQTKVNPSYDGTQYHCNHLHLCSTGLFFNGASIESQGSPGYATQNQFVGNMTVTSGITGSIVSPKNFYFDVIGSVPPGTATNLIISPTLNIIPPSGTGNSCGLPSSSRPGANEKSLDLFVFPNPIQQGSKLFLSKRVTGTVIVLNLQGQVVQKSELVESTEVPIQNLSVGTYILLCENERYKIVVL
jgi:hypothetical protein